MKKCVVLFLALFPVVAFSAPSVRMLGNKSATASTVSSGVKVAPVKSSGVEGAAMARIGSLRAKSKVNNTVSTSIDTSAATRFPVITNSRHYNITNTPKTGDTPNGVVMSADVDTIVNAVINNIENNYYNKTEVYNNQEFRQAVVEAVPVVDDPRIDAIRIGSRPVHTSDLPSGNNYTYGYIWIEEN